MGSNKMVINDIPPGERPSAPLLPARSTLRCRPCRASLLRARADCLYLCLCGAGTLSIYPQGLMHLQVGPSAGWAGPVPLSAPFE